MSKFKEVLNKKIVKIPLVIIVFVIIIVIWKSLVNSNDSYLEKYDGVDLTADVKELPETIHMQNIFKVMKAFLALMK